MVTLDKAACLKKLGEAFREERTKKGLYQSDVAEQVGIRQSHYSMIENGLRDAEFVTIVKICKLLQVDLTAFIENYL